MKQNRTFNPYIIITVVYFLANYFVLLLSGCWWDDLTFLTHDLTYINQVASQSGRPEWNLLIPFCWSLTNNGRILIFVLYLLISYFVYNIFKNSTFFNKKQSLILTLLFIVIPVNDARILMSNFPYTIGLFLFFLAFMLFVKWNNFNRKAFYRIIILITFFISFILSSLLAFYYIIFIYLFIIEYKKCNEEKIIKKILVSIKTILINYFDFFILPIVFFISNKLLFPITNSEFTGRSSITIEGLLKSFKYLPLSIFNIFSEILSLYANCMKSVAVILSLCILIVIVILKTKNNKTVNSDKIWYVLFGLLVFAIGIFAYVEVRGGIIISNGVKGRDAILTPLGIAIIIYGISLFFNNKIRNAIYAIVIVLGALSLNILYIEWQKDYYYQLSMENLMNNEIIKNNDTFFLVDLNESNIDGQRYYTININANHVFNDETRFFIPKVSNLYILESDESINESKTILNGSHMMKDYNPEDKCLDAIIIYSCDLDTMQTIRLKYYELFNKQEFDMQIEKNGKMEIYEVDNDFTELLLKENRAGNLDNDNDVLELLEEYN